MINNDILHSICDICDFNDSKIINIFSLADHEITQEQAGA
jgi:uncharacterized protein YehS (DUF1456 family)